MRRRDFFRKAAIGSTAVALDQALGPLADGAETDANAAKLATREYGRTGVRLSVIGFGGYMLAGTDPLHAKRLVAEAVERGVNYFDVAPTYKNAEVLLGPALEPYRKNVFLACKTTERQRDGARAELERSLQRLRTDHFDLYQLHAITHVKKDVDAVFAKGGAMETFIEAKKAGQVRYLGFSAHSAEAALAALDRYEFDSILFPVNFTCYYKGNFGPEVVAKAQSKGAACLAIKALARQKWPKDDPNRKKFPNCWYQPLSDPKEAGLGLRFTLSEPVTAAVSPADESLFRLALRLATNLKPVTNQETEALKRLASTLTPIFRTA
jgi:predicted aldo/keto reductase-like oxidoreductase